MDLPDNITRTILSLHHRYKNNTKHWQKNLFFILRSGTVDAINAGARVKKLLQLVTGAVYDTAQEVKFIHQERYDIVMTLGRQRAHSLVAFNWRHERDALVALAEKQGVTYEVIDGSPS